MYSEYTPIHPTSRGVISGSMFPVYASLTLDNGRVTGLLDCANLITGQRFEVGRQVMDRNFCLLF